MNAQEALLDSLDPARILERAKLTPDEWQREVLRSGAKRILLLCGRQVGKSTTAAALALHQALYIPDSLVLLISPSQRQSSELFRKVVDLMRVLGEEVPVETQSLLRLELSNNSRVLSLPGNDAGTIRGFSGVNLIVIDESAFVVDELYFALRPMLSVSKGQLVCLGTPHGKRGWFWKAWSNENEEWLRVEIKSSQCPRITPETLEQEKLSLGEAIYAQEFECAWLEDQFEVFDLALVQDLIVDIPPMDWSKPS